MSATTLALFMSMSVVILLLLIMLFRDDKPPTVIPTPAVEEKVIVVQPEYVDPWEESRRKFWYVDPRAYYTGPGQHYYGPRQHHGRPHGRPVSPGDRFGRPMSTPAVWAGPAPGRGNTPSGGHRGRGRR